MHGHIATFLSFFACWLYNNIYQNCWFWAHIRNAWYYMHGLIDIFVLLPCWYNNSDIYIYIYYCTCSPCVSSVYLAIHLGYLRGVDVIDHITFAYTGKAQSFEWLNRGFKIHFPENALPPRVDECRVHIKVSLSGQFDFSRDVELVSGLYWVSSHYVFTRPVTVEIQHCAQEDAQLQSRLTYIVASCSQEELPYQFKTLEGGVFSPSSRYGTINLTHFSGLAITSQPRPRQSLVQKLSRKMHHTRMKRYCAQLYYSSSGIHSWEVYFAIMWDLELHINVSTACMVNYCLFWISSVLIVAMNAVFRNSK